MKYRRNKVKREHGLIQNALTWLENLSTLPEVTDIIPGVIDVSHSSERGIVYKYETQTGCKLLLKSNGSIQEVFVVTKDPACVQAWVKREFPSDSPAAEQIKAAGGSRKQSVKKRSAGVSEKMKSKPETGRQRQPKANKGNKGHVPKLTSGKKQGPKVADQLDLSSRKALKRLQKSLEDLEKEEFREGMKKYFRE